MENTALEVISFGQVDGTLASRIESWARSLVGEVNDKNLPNRISIFLWEKKDDYQEFDTREKTELGVATEGDSEFLATHEAWRGYPRIHIPIENIKDLPEELAQGIVQHEIGHALLHGSAEFYQFRFSREIQEAGLRLGLEFPGLQQLVYLLSLALKDEEVVRLLDQIGFGSFQKKLLEYLLRDTEEERQTWDLIHHDPVPRRLALAVFLKTILPNETITQREGLEAELLNKKWEEAYSWLTDEEKSTIRSFSRFIIDQSGLGFQDRLEKVLWELLLRIEF